MKFEQKDIGANVSLLPAISSGHCEIILQTVIKFELEQANQKLEALGHTRHFFVCV